MATFDDTSLTMSHDTCMLVKTAGPTCHDPDGKNWLPSDSGRGWCGSGSERLVCSSEQPESVLTLGVRRGAGGAAWRRFTKRILENIIVLLS